MTPAQYNDTRQGRRREPHAGSAENRHPACVDLSRFDNSGYAPGRSLLVRALWYMVSAVVFESPFFPVSGIKATVLRWFGARVGVGLVIKPGVRIKYPWRLTVGDHCWIGQDAWIDSLADVVLGSHVCISQQAYVCTGSHDHRRDTFDLIARPIIIRSGSWIGSRALLLPGVTVGPNAVVGAGSVVSADVPAAAIVVGNPARSTGQTRETRKQPAQ